MPKFYRLNTKIRLTMLCFSGFELYSRWVPLVVERTADHERTVYIAVSLEFTFLRAKRPQRRWLQGNRRVCMGNKEFET